MGNFVGSSQIGSHQTDQFRVGLDLNLCRLPFVLGEYRAADTATFRQGQALMFDTNNELVASDGNHVAGMAKWPKATALNTLVIDMEISFATAGATFATGFANISNLAIRSATGNGGTQYTVTTDYTVNTTTGVITQVALGAIPLATTVYASFTRALTASEMLANGTNWFNGQDDVSLSDRKIALISGNCRIFTIEYDTSRQYSLQGVNSNLYVNSSAILTNNTSSARFVGHVVQLPRADYPYLGAQLDFNVAAAT